MGLMIKYGGHREVLEDAWGLRGSMGSECGKMLREVKKRCGKGVRDVGKCKRVWGGGR